MSNLVFWWGTYWLYTQLSSPRWKLTFAPLTDYYIYTAADINHTYTYEKVAYSQLSSDSGHIRATVPLSPGLNSVRLYVRDQNKSEAYENILVFRR